jgi:hypothetical protein
VNHPDRRSPPPRAPRPAIGKQLIDHVRSVHLIFRALLSQGSVSGKAQRRLWFAGGEILIDE